MRFKRNKAHHAVREFVEETLRHARRLRTFSPREIFRAVEELEGERRVRGIRRLRRVFLLLFVLFFIFVPEFEDRSGDESGDESGEKSGDES